MLSYLLDFLAGGLLQFGWWQMLLCLLVVTQITIFTVTLYLHRSQAHRGVDSHPVIAHFFRFWSWLTTSMITREWAAIHRKHHAKCETEDDPHSPMVKGIGTVFWRGGDIYREARLGRASIEQFGKGCPDDGIERKRYSRFPNLGVQALLLASVILFGAKGVAVWAIQMAWIPFWAAGVINGLGHWHRNSTTTDTATNLSPWGVWIGGEELHNHHHAFPSSARFAMRRFEFDIGWAAIRLLQAVHLAKVLRVAPRLNLRPNTKAPDAETLKALVAHRFQAMTDFQRNVLKPDLCEEAAIVVAKLRALLPRKLRHGLVNDGRWLKPDAREQLRSWVASKPRIQTLIEHRNRLADVLESCSHDAAEKLKHLQAWCVAVEVSGVRALQDYAARLRGYALLPA